MPAGRPRKTTTRSNATAQSQSTLSFHNRSRVTKPSITSDSSAKKAQPELSETTDPEVEEVKPESVEETTSKPPVPIEPEVQEPEEPYVSSPPKASAKSKSKPTSKTQTAESTATTAASKITDAQLRKYWQAEEASRLAPRVHQSAVPLHEKILRHFDLSSQYGPCIGIPRLKRWHRAHAIGLEPPIEVLAVLVREEEKEVKGGTEARQCGKMAYIDELAGGRAVLVE